MLEHFAILIWLSIVSKFHELFCMFKKIIFFFTDYIKTKHSSRFR